MAKESRDQRRKKKLAEERRKARLNQTSAYTGLRYKTDELVPIWMQTELGIYLSYVMSDRKLLDQTVMDALETFIDMMRDGTLPPLTDTDEIRYEAGNEEDLVIGAIRRNWANHFATEWRPARDDLIGVLRSVLGTAQTMKAPGPQSQNYMRYVTKFVTQQLGIKVQAVPAGQIAKQELSEGELLRLGRRWIAESSPETRIGFLEQFAQLLHHGPAIRLIEQCQLLLKEVPDSSSPVAIELSVLIQKARESQI